MLLGSNGYVQHFVQAMDLPPQNLANYEIVICVDGSVDCCRYNALTSSEVAGLMHGEWMGWLHGCFLVPHFVLFLMVMAVLIPMFLDSTFLPSSKQLSRLCLICLPFYACSQVMVIAIHETSGCGLRAVGYGGLVMPTVLMTLCILSCSTHTESPASTQILLVLPLRLWMG